ncbi:glycoside hydrolase family 18 [Bacteroides acidifaciens]|uniref:glycoside hydrolase family 18 n=1 Tax=Bacteroides acidifaciens TaxID=85831 RepID=UPI003015315E
MNNIKLWILLSLLMGVGCSCTDIQHLDVEKEALNNLLERDKEKWAEEDKLREENERDSILIAEENKRLYELYLQDLRKYKASKHCIMFGWFNSWSAITPGAYAQLNQIPDSMDVVSIWGNCFNLDEARKKQLKEVQSKGTKVIVGWIVENIGAQISNMKKEDWSDNPEEAVEQYAQAITDSILKYGYDGFDLDYEPPYVSPFKDGNHCGDWPKRWKDDPSYPAKWPEDWQKDWAITKPLISCHKDDNKELENLFFKTLREKLGNDKMININGAIHWLSAESAQYFDYYVAQSYEGQYATWQQPLHNPSNRYGVDVADRVIYTETFQNKKANREKFTRYANYVMNTLDGKAGGIGAFHINEDALDSNDYRNVRAAISIMNPPIK